MGKPNKPQRTKHQLVYQKFINFWQSSMGLPSNMDPLWNFYDNRTFFTQFNELLYRRTIHKCRSLFPHVVCIRLDLAENTSFP